MITGTCCCQKFDSASPNGRNWGIWHGNMAASRRDVSVQADESDEACISRSGCISGQMSDDKPLSNTNLLPRLEALFLHSNMRCLIYLAYLPDVISRISDIDHSIWSFGFPRRGVGRWLYYQLDLARIPMGLTRVVYLIRLGRSSYTVCLSTSAFLPVRGQQVTQRLLSPGYRKPQASGPAVHSKSGLAFMDPFFTAR